MKNYYAEKLNASKLFQVYQTDIPRVKQYLEAEVARVARDLAGQEIVLELGAGYGRILKALAPFARNITGVEISSDSVLFGKEYLKGVSNCSLVITDAFKLKYETEFDVVLCLQNGLSAIKGEPMDLVNVALRSLVPGGRVYFSTYSAAFWDQRLARFMEQAGKGLLGEIDMGLTKDGQIVCKDGFVARTFSHRDLENIGHKSRCQYHIEEVDGSSLFLILKKG
ncbi:MAG TPA: class I SAM-dependent methyltransferase [Desulfobacteraceae bacterium]|nr:class I SAM-dependent methyltransferase [Desulfobacteraceae bacterium]